VNGFCFFFQQLANGLIHIGHGRTFPAGAVARFMETQAAAETACLAWHGTYIDHYAGNGNFRPCPDMLEWIEIFREAGPEGGIF
jgi:hypothetical protein